MMWADAMSCEPLPSAKGPYLVPLRHRASPALGQGPYGGHLPPSQVTRRFVCEPAVVRRSNLCGPSASPASQVVGRVRSAGGNSAVVEDHPASSVGWRSALLAPSA